MKEENCYTVILGVIGADCHAVGNKILYAFLTENGVNVVNLGVMVSQEEFILTAKEQQADAILVSSIYGHGEIDCQGFRKNCERQQLYDVVLYVGGNLVIGKQKFAEVTELFEGMGFDRVFPPTADLASMVSQLKQDIGRKRQGLTARSGPTHACLPPTRSPGPTASARSSRTSACLCLLNRPGWGNSSQNCLAFPTFATWIRSMR